MAFSNFWLNFATLCNYNQLHSSAEFCRHHLCSSLISLDGFLDILGGLFSTRQLEGSGNIWKVYGLNYGLIINIFLIHYVVDITDYFLRPRLRYDGLIS